MHLHFGTGLVEGTVVSACLYGCINFSSISTCLVCNWNSFAVCSAVGVLPLSLQYGFSVVEKYGTFYFISHLIKCLGHILSILFSSEWFLLFYCIPVLFSKVVTVSKSRRNLLSRSSWYSAFSKLDCRFLKGASSIDQHFQSTPFEKNIPVSCISCVIIQFSCLFAMSINTRDSWSY